MEESHSDQQRKCAFCDSSSLADGGNLMKCSGCLITYYCNREHQVADWKQHKQFCKELQVKRSKETEVTKSNETVPVSIISPTNNSRILQTETTKSPSMSTNQSTKSVHFSVIQSSKSSESFVNTNDPPKAPEVKQEQTESESAQRIRQQRVSVIQMATKTNPTPRNTTMADNKKRPRPDTSKPKGRPGPKKLKRSIQQGEPHSNTVAAIGGQNLGASASTGDQFGPKRDHSLNYPLDPERDSRFRSGVGSRHDVVSRVAKMAQFVAASLREYGWAIVDKFMGARHCRGVLKEMQMMHERGDFTEGRLMMSKTGAQLHGIRSDSVLFLKNGSDDGIHIGLLVSVIDSLIYQLASSIPPYNVCGRTRPMLTCYPGQRSRYLHHVDNPDNDGRCLTATYYLNEDWRPAHGGLLRMYPVSAFKPVDVEPIFDRLVLYWSDKRNPHEVLPSYRKRFSVNIWYYDRDEKEAAESRQTFRDNVSSATRKGQTMV